MPNMYPTTIMVGPTASMPRIPSLGGTYLSGDCVPITKEDPRASVWCKMFGIHCCAPDSGGPGAEPPSEPWYYTTPGMVGIGAGIVGVSTLTYFLVKRKRRR